MKPPLLTTVTVEGGNRESDLPLDASGSVAAEPAVAPAEQASLLDSINNNIYNYNYNNNTHNFSI